MFFGATPPNFVQKWYCASILNIVNKKVLVASCELDPDLPMTVWIIPNACVDYSCGKESCRIATISEIIEAKDFGFRLLINY